MKTCNTKYKFKAVLSVILTVILLCMSSVPVFAATGDPVPFATYTYWDGQGNKQPVDIKPIYSVEKIIDGQSLGINSFLELQDAIEYKGNLYILDSGNSRIVCFDKNYNVLNIISSIKDKNGNEVSFKGAKGIFFDNDNLYIADTANKRILVTKNGIIEKIVEKPTDKTIPKTFDFAPCRLIKDDSGYFYVLSESCYYGIMVFSSNFEFFGFYGANEVEASFTSALKSMVQSLFDSEEKHNASVKTLPYTLLDISLDAQGFIVGVDGGTAGQIRRFGLSGSNTLKTPGDSASTDGFNFADSPVIFSDPETGDHTASNICAVGIDSENYYYVIDKTHGRIFVYDTDITLIGAFGGGNNFGSQKGTFISPSSIECFGEDLIVTDFGTGKITVFRATEYGKTLKTANILTRNNKYTEAKPYWEKVYSLDRNNQLAYRGLALAALEEKDYKNAMELAKQGLDTDTYSAAFEQVRNKFISDNFWWMMLLILAAIAGLIVFSSIKKRREIKLVSSPNLRVVLRTTFHPFESFQNIKYKQMYSLTLATVLMLLFYVTSILSKLYGGFIFGYVDKSSFNAILTLLGTVGLVLLWTVSNWLICILFEGKGRIKEIYTASCYSLIPIIIYQALYPILSNVLLTDAISWLNLFKTICYLGTILLLLLSVTVIHDFTFFKAIGASIVIVMAMLIVGFVLFLMLTLWQDMIAFVIRIFNEATLK